MVMEKNERHKISILLPYYWWEDIPKTLEMFGFKILWPDYEQVAQRRMESENLAMDNDPDLAIDWQWGRYDFPILNLLRKYGKNTPVFLARNWNGTLPDNLYEIGYAGYLNVPFKIREMFSFFYKVLPDKRKRDFLELHGTKKPCHLFRIE
jgi:hypothetical protein